MYSNSLFLLPLNDLLFCPTLDISLKHKLNGLNYVLFHHQAPTGIENVKFREETVDLLPGTSSGK